MSSLIEPVPKKKILIVAITRLGDLLQASPTIIGLKNENPGSSLTVLVDRGFSEICHGIPGIDEVYEIDLAMMVRSIARGGAGIVEAYKYFDSLAQDLRDRQFDFCLNMSSSSYTAILLKILDVPDSRGWYADEEGKRLIINPWSMLFAAFVYHSNRDYNSINLVDIFRCSCGVKAHPHHLVFNLNNETITQVDATLAGLELEGRGPLICVQAGASQEKRQWEIERFVDLLQRLISEMDARIVLTGTKSEEGLINSILQGCDSKHVKSLAGKTKLSELGALLRKADLLVTGDTGTMHLAVAVGTPVVALFLASALCYETGPYSPGNLVCQTKISCCPCNPNYPCARPDCHEQITAELVTYLVKERLSKTDGEILETEIPREIAPSEHVSVFITEFDSDGFLNFRHLNEDAGRYGIAGHFFVRARNAYRELWKREFGAVDKVIRDPKSAGLPPAPKEYYEEGIRRIIQLSHSGREALTRLKRLIVDESSPPHLLGMTTTEIENNDRAVEDVGLAFPILGAVVRMFVMEKENLRGDDPLEIASELMEIYGSLARRAAFLERHMNLS